MSQNRGTPLHLLELKRQEEVILFLGKLELLGDAPQQVLESDTAGSERQQAVTREETPVPFSHPSLSVPPPG